MWHSLIKLFHLSNLLQMPNDYRRVDFEFFGNLSCSCKRISFDDGSHLVSNNFQWPATTFLSFKALVSFAKLLEPPCTFIIHSWAKCIADVASYFHCFMTHLNLNKRSAQIGFLSNIVSIVKSKYKIKASNKPLAKK